MNRALRSSSPDEWSQNSATNGIKGMETQHEIWKDRDSILQGIKRIIDRICGLLDECFADVNSIGNAMMHTTRDFINSSANNLQSKKTETLDELMAYICIATFYVLIEIFQTRVNDLFNKVDDKEHNDRLKRIEASLNYVRKTIAASGEKVKELDKMFREILRLDGNAPQGLYIDFDHSYDLIVNDLNVCTDHLTTAMQELKEGFESIKRYVSRCTTEAIPTAVIVMDSGRVVELTVIFRSPVSGHHSEIALTDADRIRAQYATLDAEITGLQKALSETKGKLQAYGNARKLKEEQDKKRTLEVENQKAKEENERLKLHHWRAEDFKRRMKKQQSNDQEEIRLLREQLLTSRSCS